MDKLGKAEQLNDSGTNERFRHSCTSGRVSQSWANGLFKEDGRHRVLCKESIRLSSVKEECALGDQGQKAEVEAWLHAVSWDAEKGQRQP